MLKGLIKKELRQLRLGPKSSSAPQPPACGQTQAWQARSANDHHMASGQGKGHSSLANACEVLATARGASGM